MNVKYQSPVFTKVSAKKKKRKKLEYIIYTLILIFVAFNIAGFYIGGKVFQQFFQPSTNKGIDLYDKYKSTFDEKRFNNMQTSTTEYSIRSTHGYNLHLLYIKNTTPTKNTIIITHDIGGSIWSVMEYAFMYIDKGFNVVLWDLPDHGKSGGNTVTYGYNERDDLDNLVTWVYENKNKSQGMIGIHGIGLGADIAIMQSKFNEKSHRVKFYIVDSPFSTLKDYFKLQIINNYGINKSILHKIPPLENQLLNLTLLYTNKYGTSIKSNFPLKEISPLEDEKSNTTPMMFICGDKDSSTPEYMCKALYSASKGPKDFYLAPNSTHGNCYMKNKIDYMNKIYNFIDNKAK